MLNIANQIFFICFVKLLYLENFVQFLIFFSCPFSIAKRNSEVQTWTASGT